MTVQARKKLASAIKHEMDWDEQIEAAAAQVDGRTEMDALVAYLQGLGINRSNRR